MFAYEEVVAALDAQTAVLAGVLEGLSEEEAGLPTRCDPWDVAALAAHTVGAVLRVGDMVEEPVPDGGGVALVSATGYYAPDVRFSPEVNADRVRSAVEAAARRTDAGEPGRVLRAGWAALSARLAAEEGGRRVLTRHGDPMYLRDFLVTRVVEVVLHGWDLADALGREPWTTRSGLDLVTRLVFGAADREALERVLPGVWSGAAAAERALRAVTGRSDGGAAGRDALTAAGVRFLALG